MTNPTLWNQVLVWPIVNVLVILYKMFEFTGIPGALGFAIISLTVLIRLITYPLTQSQLKSAQKIQKLKPQLDELVKKYKNDKIGLQQAQVALYKEAGVNPAGGCLPLLIQMPVFYALYSVFIQILTKDSTQTIETLNKVLYHPAFYLSRLNLDFLGINLTVKPNQWQTADWWLLLIPIITGGLQFWQIQTITPTSPSNSTLSQEEKQQQSMQKNMMLLFPLMIGYATYSFPVGLALYWNTFTLFGIIQQSIINKKHER